ncbi:acyl-CoA dehydrogenase family protein [Streptomyces melanogenes]|uniref:acyl-CoA dehydrogenase family protein n=1 Tax=Streptomyces melanogenes TaxID=67326 RepID=UPI00167D264F|nr:acyl-CoA dehydrogenase family protein [Streptomyces melanogenes]GGP42089.1 acyl-CoA dehydrogenase [Streptomyces melanogenes]
MRFLPTAEQRDFTRSLDALLTASDTPSVVRSWSAGDPGPGRALWARLAEAGVFALAAPEAQDGMGRLPVELALAYRELGRHAVPGPLVETAAVTALLSHLADAGDPAPAKRLLPGVLTGESVVTLGVPGGGGYVLDAEGADVVLVVKAGATGPELRLAPGHGPVHPSLDPARRLARPDPGGELLAAGPLLAEAVGCAVRWARLAAAAQAVGVAEELLRRTVAYVKQRTQFGVPIGSFQAVKHRLADTLLAVEFARPLVYGAALTLAPADLAAAKAAAGEAAYASSRAALQLHGAIGYTEELDLSLWLRKARPLRDAWGTPAECRAEILAAHP